MGFQDIFPSLPNFFYITNVVKLEKNQLLSFWEHESQPIHWSSHRGPHRSETASGRNKLYCATLLATSEFLVGLRLPSCSRYNMGSCFSRWWNWKASPYRGRKWPSTPTGWLPMERLGLCTGTNPISHRPSLRRVTKGGPTRTGSQAQAHFLHWLPGRAR